MKKKVLYWIFGVLLFCGWADLVWGQTYTVGDTVDNFGTSICANDSGYWNYNTKTIMKKIIKDTGYDVIQMGQFRPGANYAIFRVPGKQNPMVYKINEITID